MSAGADRPAGERASRLDAIPRADVLALIPAAGRALRLGARETSKEILPVGDRIACQDLLQAFDAAGIRRGLLLTRREKLDVPRRIAALGLPSLRLATLLVPQTPSVPHTIDRAWPFLRHRTIAFGFPDVLLEPVTVFRQLLRRHADTGADLVLALFPAAEPERSDLVAVDGSGRILEVVVKRPGSALRRELADPRAAAGPEIQLGHLVQSALEAGLVGRAIDLPSGRALDIGTPEALAYARSIGGR
jgi:glucose-1-phosphate thymidylyltransferase